MKNEKSSRAAQAADKYIVRFPEGMRDEIAAAAQRNDRSMNAEIVHRLQGSLSSGARDLAGLPDGLLLDEVIARYGARLQIIVAPEVAEAHGIEAPTPARSKKSRS